MTHAERVTGLRAHSTRIPRASVRCLYCKARWIENARFGEHGRNHQCSLIDEAMLKTRTPITDRLSYGFATTVFGYREVQWTYRADASKCDSRCESARGHSCDCRCQGEHHGAATTC